MMCLDYLECLYIIYVQDFIHILHDKGDNYILHVCMCECMSEKY